MDTTRNITFKKMVELSSDIINLVNADGVVIYASPAVSSVLGFSREEAVGMGIKDWIHPDDLPRTTRFLQKILAHPGDVFRIRARFRHKSGAWRWVEVVANNLLNDPDVGAIVTGGRDITERVAAEQALRASEARYRNVVETMHEGIAQVDNDGRVQFVNARFCELTGYTVEELQGQVIHELLLDPEKDQDQLAVLRAQEKLRAQGVSTGYDLWVRHKSGRRILFRINGSPVFDADGKLVGTVGMHADITDQHKAEAVLRTYADELEQRVRRRTDELQRMVNLMAGRELRIAELKRTIKQLRAQLLQAGLTPVADDPLLEED